LHHKEVCAPGVSWLFTHVDALVVLIICASLGYATHIIGISNLVEFIENDAPKLNNVISTVFGSAATFGKWVRGSWIFAVVAHTAEALYVLYHAKTTLKMGVKAQLLWYALVSSVGMPITKEFLHMMKIQASQKEKK
jgi:hypothetical protein